jgi:hypothetical protein
MAYGLKTFKSNGTTLVLQNASKSGVYGRIYTLSTSDAIANTGGFYSYQKQFPEYTGRTIRAFQLKPGPNDWIISYINSIPRIEFNQGANPANYGVSNVNFNYTSTTLYIFVK